MITTPVEDLALPDSGTAFKPDAAYEATEVYATIAALPEDFRLALVAVDIVGLSYREAAKVLATKEATITTRLYRARRQVARALDLDIGRGEIDFFRRVGLGGEFQKDRFAAGVAAEYHADALGFLPAELLEFWRRREGEVAQGLTMRTIEHDPRILQLQFILRRKRDAHAQPVRGL